MLATGVLAGCVVLFLILFEAFHALVGRNFTALRCSLLTTAVVLVVVWIVVWRKEVRWTPERCWLTGLAVAVAAAAGTMVYFWCQGVMGSPRFSSPPQCLLIAGMLFAVVWILLTVFIWRETPGERTRRMVAGVSGRLRCPKCGYNMTGLLGARCPECGTQYTLDELLSSVLGEDGP